MPLFTSPTWANEKRVNAKLQEILQIVENPDRFNEGAAKLTNWLHANPANRARVNAALKKKGTVQANALLSVLPSGNRSLGTTRNQRNALRNAAEPPMSLKNFLRSSRRSRRTRRNRRRLTRSKRS